MAECSQSSFPFEAHFGRRVEARFDGSAMTTDGGALLLRAVDKKLRLLGTSAKDARHARLLRRLFCCGSDVSGLATPSSSC